MISTNVNFIHSKNTLRRWFISVSKKRGKTEEGSSKILNRWEDPRGTQPPLSIMEKIWIWFDVRSSQDIDRWDLSETTSDHLILLTFLTSLFVSVCLSVFSFLSLSLFSWFLRCFDCLCFSFICHSHTSTNLVFVFYLFVNISNLTIFTLF